MGIERDYLMRQIMMLLEVIQKIVNFRKKGSKQEADEQIDLFYNYLKLEKEINFMSIEELMEYLVIQKKLTNNHLELYAYVLKEQGELSTITEQKQDFYRKAYFLLDKTDRESTSFSMQRQMVLAELRNFLN